MKASSIRRAVTTLALVAGAFGLTCAPASADVTDTDWGRISNGTADFGAGPHAGGAPLNDGKITWNRINGNVTATLTGSVYWDDWSSGGCARVRYRLYLIDGSFTTKYSELVCQAGSRNPLNPFDLVPSTPVSLPLTAKLSLAKRVHVVTQKASSKNGPWTNDGGFSRNYGQINGVD